MALDAKWNDDLDLARVIQTPKVGLGPFISQPEIPIEFFNPLGYTVPGVGVGCVDSYDDGNDDRFTLCQQNRREQGIFRPKLTNPLPLPHPLDISIIIHNRDYINRGGSQEPIDLDGWPYEVVRRSLIELPTPFGFASTSASSSDEENDRETEEESTPRRSLPRRDTEEEASASSYPASSEDTPLVLRSAMTRQISSGSSHTTRCNEIGSDVHRNGCSRRAHVDGQQELQLAIETTLDVEKQKKLSTIASESDANLNTEDAVSESPEHIRNDESDVNQRDCSLVNYGDTGDIDPEMASLTKSLEELDTDLNDYGCGRYETNSYLEPKQSAQPNIKSSHNSIKDITNKNTLKSENNEHNGESLEQKVRNAMKERDRRDAEVVSAAVFSSLSKNESGSSNINTFNASVHKSPRKHGLSPQHIKTNYYHNLNFPPIANANNSIDQNDGQGSNRGLNSPHSRPSVEPSKYAAPLRAGSSSHITSLVYMERRATSSDVIGDPPPISIRQAYQRSFSSSDAANGSESSDVVITSSINVMPQNGNHSFQPKDVSSNTDETKKKDVNPDSYSTVV